MTDKYKELRDAAANVTPQDFDSAEVKISRNGDYVYCPVCGGEGELEAIGEYCNYDNAALGVQFFGIGNEHISAEAYYRAANPETIRALLAERDALLEALENIASGEIYPVQIARAAIEAAKRQGEGNGS